jgi:hypothetical protein
MEFRQPGEHRNAGGEREKPEDEPRLLGALRIERRER